MFRLVQYFAQFNSSLGSIFRSVQFFARFSIFAVLIFAVLPIRENKNQAKYLTFTVALGVGEKKEAEKHLHTKPM